jgi:phage terminase large subunit-like protein
LTDEEILAIQYDFFGFWARESQQPPPGDWRTWVVLAGRGFGKTRTGAEWIRWMVERGQARRIALVARTKADIHHVMVLGESGIVTTSPPYFRPEYQPTNRRLVWPNGAEAFTYSADEPNQLRGPEHDAFWADELASWRSPATMGELNAWDNLMLGLRLGQNPKGVVTTTPKRGVLLRRILKKAGTVVTGGSTYENIDNLAPSFIEEIVGLYEGTRLGRQELHAAVEEDNPDALWRFDDMIDATRRPRPAQLKRIVVAVDPEAGSTADEGAETGIIVAARGFDDHYYVIGDFSVRGTPNVWGNAVIRAYHHFEADMIVGEVNNGGEMVGYVIQSIDPTVPFRAVRASRGKAIRAEPVSAIYERGMAHHVETFAVLEEQMCQWVPGMDASPDRLDANVWAATELMLNGGGAESYGAAADPKTLWTPDRGYRYG